MNTKTFSKNNLSQSCSSFRSNKNKSHQYFKDTKVESCSHVFEHQNKCFAVPFKIINSKGRPLSAFKYTQPKAIPHKTVYQKDYSIKKIMHAGMGKKPLVVYEPNSYRNRLPIEETKAPYSNKSKIQIGQQSDINFKQWVSTTRDSYKWPVKTPVSNSGILSDIFRRSHKKITSHN